MERPPSVDALARSLAGSGLPQPLLVDVARQAIADGAVVDAPARADALRRTLLTPVVNATGVLLHTNLGRAPVAHQQAARFQAVELDLATGERGSRQRGVGRLFARLCEAEAAMVVNNNAAAVLLVLAALAAGRDVPVSRGESVEIGGGFRVPEVMEQSGARLVDVGTTNRTRARRLPTRRRRRRRGDGAQGAPEQLRRHRVRRDDLHRGAGDPGRAGRRRPGQWVARRHLPVVAWRPPAAVAGRRAGGAPDARGRCRARDVQRRQAARWPAGRDHRRARRSRRPLRGAPPGAGVASGQPRPRRPPGPRHGVPRSRRPVTRPVLAAGRGAGRRAQRPSCGDRRGRRGRRRGDGRRARGRIGTRGDDPERRRARRGRPARRAPGPRSAGDRPGSRRRHGARPASGRAAPRTR